MTEATEGGTPEKHYRKFLTNARTHFPSNWPPNHKTHRLLAKKLGLRCLTLNLSTFEHKLSINNIGGDSAADRIRGN